MELGDFKKISTLVNSWSEKQILKSGRMTGHGVFAQFGAKYREGKIEFIYFCKCSAFTCGCSLLVEHCTAGLPFAHKTIWGGG